VATISEDLRFQYFLAPAIHRIANECGVEVDLHASEITNGCRVQVLLERTTRLRDVDVLVIGADSKHGGKHQTFKRKAGLMQQTIRDNHAASGTYRVLAIAEPSVEAWLLSDPGAFDRGLSRALDLEFAMPKHWPNPRTEHEAKRELGKLLREGAGAALPLGGFEFADMIIAEMELVGSRSPSLAEWARELARAFRSGVVH
jgi:hypothetical protein